MVVATASVGVFAFVAVMGLDLEVNAERLRVQQDIASHTAATAAVVYRQAGGRAEADLDRAYAVADGAGASLVVTDASGDVVAQQGVSEQHSGPVSPTRAIDHPVIVDGERVGTVSLSFKRPATSALSRSSIGWLLGAAVVALGLAAVVAVLMARQITRPVTQISEVGRRFAAGDHAARAHVEATGEIGELARTMNDAADAVLAAEQARLNIAADVAHELRTPLAALQAGLEEMRDGLMPADPAALGRLHDQATRMGRVVGELAALSSAEAAPRVTDSTRIVDLAAVAEAEMASRQSHMHCAGLELVGDLHSTLVRADEDRLHEIIGNLLANAAQYCRAGDHVAVTVRQQDDRAMLQVSDTGPGIPADELPHVFERFWRGSRESGTAGSGLGLAIVRALVTAYDGNVTVASTPGAGAVFSIDLPVARPVGVIHSGV